MEIIIRMLKESCNRYFPLLRTDVGQWFIKHWKLEIPKKQEEKKDHLKEWKNSNKIKLGGKEEVFSRQTGVRAYL